MHREYLMGNEAMALGALAAGVNVVAGYPGTPSTEVLETVAKHNAGGRIMSSGQRMRRRQWRSAQVRRTQGRACW